MKITYDPAKNIKNIRERGLSFDRVVELDWETAIAREDKRRDYGEIRTHVLAMLEHRLYAAVYTKRAGSLRVISFRKANAKEELWYAKEKKAQSRAY